MNDVMVNTFIRGAVKELKTTGKCYCYFEWQIEEIIKKCKNCEALIVKKKDGYYQICKL